MTARAWWLFAAVSILWGVPYLLIEIAIEELEPGFVAWARTALAATVLLPAALATGALRSVPRGPVVAFAVVELAVPWPLIAFGERQVSSSLAAILIAVVPLLVALITVAARLEPPPSRGRLAGMVIGLAGVAALVGLDVGSEPAALLGAGAVLIAAAGYAIGALVLQRDLAAGHPLGPIAAAMGVAVVLLAPVGLPVWPSRMPSNTVLAALASLGLACSALAFLLFFRLVAVVGAARATVITYVCPVVALALGVALRDEPLHVSTAVGLCLILAGSRLATMAQPRQP